MPPTPLISIIIPHLNQPEFLKRCLASLSVQNWDMSQAEIIIVDNGSHKLPSDICDGPAVRLEREECPGPGPARNRGVAVSSGGILAFIDADCIADSNWVPALYGALSEEQDQQSAQIVGGDVRIAFADPANPTQLEAYESIFAYRQLEYIERQGFSGTGNLAMRRTVYDAVGPFAGIEVAEDRDWGHRATALGFRIDYLPEMIVFHPARRDMGELQRKWDRHVSHDFAAKGQGLIGRLRWLAMMVTIGLSPVIELRRIATSRRVETPKQRVAAFLVLVQIRSFRVWRMIPFLFFGSAAARNRSWNQN